MCHTSILAIEQICISFKYFSFLQVSYKQVLKNNNKLDASKANQENDIPTKIIRKNAYIFAYFLHESFNNSIVTSVFTSVFKKGPKTSKENFRPLNTLPNVSKIFECILFQQLCSYFDIFSKYQCCFKLGLRAHYSLIPRLKNKKKLQMKVKHQLLF